MSMSTSYRYEVERPGAQNLRKALKKQEQRIKNDEWCSERDAAVNNDILVNQIADWAEKLEETSELRKAKRWQDETITELSLANKELAAVRKAQLRKLLQEEQLMFKQQLNETDLSTRQESKRRIVSGWKKVRNHVKKFRKK